ncbi:hypothetical protein PH505_bs00130 [Pseudoalteromonas distincta]|nr:hypothetical protein PH505_bs00130 [Pseudoalteromonas distincta]
MHLNNPELTFELVFMSKTRNLLGRVNLCGLNPKGSACMVFMLRYHLFMGNNHTT